MAGALDRRRDVHGVLVIQNLLVKLDPRAGAVEVLLEGSDDLGNPASVAFGTRCRDRNRLDRIIYAVLPRIPPADLGAVSAYGAGVPGWPFPR